MPPVRPPHRRHRRCPAEILHPDHCWLGCTDGRAVKASHLMLTMQACETLQHSARTDLEQADSASFTVAVLALQRRHHYRRLETPSEALEAAFPWFPCRRPAQPPLCRCHGCLHTQGRWRCEDACTLVTPAAETLRMRPKLCSEHRRSCTPALWLPQSSTPAPDAHPCARTRARTGARMRLHPWSSHCHLRS